jgi:hypothetical protein
MDTAVSVYRYFFRPVEERGRILPFTRFDILVSALLAVALMAAISYSAEPVHGWTIQRAGIVMIVVVTTIVIAQHRRIVLGCAVGIITWRFIVGLLLGTHPLFMLLGAVLCGTIAWGLLRNSD